MLVYAIDCMSVTLMLPVYSPLSYSCRKIYQLVILAFLYLYVEMVFGMFTIKEGCVE